MQYIAFTQEIQLRSKPDVKSEPTKLQKGGVACYAMVPAGLHIRPSKEGPTKCHNGRALGWLLFCVAKHLAVAWQLWAGIQMQRPRKKGWIQ